jgi:hypothetical protein
MAVINCGVTSGKEEEKKRRFCTAGEAIGRLDSQTPASIGVESWPSAPMGFYSDLFIE